MKTILVTGAAGGIGSAIVRRILSEGLGVLACDQDEKGLGRLVASILKRNSKAEISSAVFDVADPTAVENFAKKLPKTLYGLVNNAGIYWGKDLFDYDLEGMQRMLSVNLFSTIQLSQIVGKFLVKKKGGVIVNISSISAFEGSSDALYGTTKAGLIGLTKSCALTFAPWVRVNAVAPGLVDTSMINAIPKWRLAEFEKEQRLKGRISPEAVASSVWFLLSDESRHTSGCVVDLNSGGYFR